MLLALLLVTRKWFLVFLQFLILAMWLYWIHFHKNLWIIHSLAVKTFDTPKDNVRCSEWILIAMNLQGKSIFLLKLPTVLKGKASDRGREAVVMYIYCHWIYVDTNREIKTTQNWRWTEKKKNPAKFSFLHQLLYRQKPFWIKYAAAFFF